MHFSEHKPYLLINIFILCSGVKYLGNINIENEIDEIVKPTLLNPVTLVFSLSYIMILEISQLSDYFQLFYQNCDIIAWWAVDELIYPNTNAEN